MMRASLPARKWEDHFMTLREKICRRLHSRDARHSVALAAILFGCIVGSGAQVYVSPKGSDEAAGTLRHPVRTLIRARDLVRPLRNKQVLLDDGIYRLSEPLVLSQGDSGISFAAVKAARPVLSGAVQVSGWTQVDAARNLWKAPAPTGLTNSRQMYVNGVRANRTRGRVPVKLQMTATGYTASGPAMAQWKNVTDVEFVYTGGNSVWNEPSEGLGSWTEPRCPIAAIDGTTITMAQPCWNNSTKRVMLPSGERTANLVGPQSVGKEPVYVENAYELLGTPGEWYFDRPAGTLYYVPRAGEDLTTADVEVPILESLVTVAGTASEPAHDITFSGIEFSYATGSDRAAVPASPRSRRTTRSLVRTASQGRDFAHWFPRVSALSPIGRRRPGMSRSLWEKRPLSWRCVCASWSSRP